MRINVPLLFLLLSIIACSPAEQKGSNTSSVEKEIIHAETFADFKPMLEKAEGNTLFVYNFWATWCKPCLKEMPYFIKLDSAYADKKVEVVLVSLDDPELIETRVKPFIERKGISQQVVVLSDPKQNDWIPQISSEWSGSIPATLIKHVPKDIHHFREQEFTYDSLRNWIDEVLKERDS